MIYMTFLGVFWACFLLFFLYKRPPKHPLKKSYRSYFRRAQIRWVIWRSSSFRIGPARHRVSRVLRARNPGRVRKESRKSSPEAGPPKSRKSAPQSLKRVQNLTFGLFWDSGAHSFGTLGVLPRGTLSGLFSDSSGPEGPGRPCAGRGRS